MEIPTLPDVLKDLQACLKPYCKDRQEIARTRRILACNLDSHLHINEQTISRPLSLGAASDASSSAHVTRGLYRDYLRALQNSSRAKNAYASALLDSIEEPESQANNGVDLVTSSQDAFLNLVHTRQKYERLRILQDYIDMLGQKAPASRDYFDAKLALRKTETHPPMPLEILGLASAHRRPVDGEVHDLVDRLEKAILRAKLLLKREQKLLARIQSENSRQTGERGSRIDALESTRNELIVWIEIELSRASESSPNHEQIAPTHSQTLTGKGHLQTQLESSKLHYSRYTSSRQDLISVTEDQLMIMSTRIDGAKEAVPAKVYYHLSSLLPPITPYLAQLLAISDGQKIMIQQIWHVTITFAKQLKENGQGLDRLADESHLLSTHPLQKAASFQTTFVPAASFEDEVSNGEKPDLSCRVQAWVFASASASVALKSFVSGRLDEGGVALLEAQESLLELLGFLGNDIESAQDESKEDSTVTWALLNGKLGVI